MVNLMRIVIPMLSYYPDRPSGSTRLAFDEALYWANNGHEVWVITHGIKPEMPIYKYQEGLHVLRYQYTHLSLFNPRRMGIHQKRTRDLLIEYVGNEIDLVHGHSLLQYDGALSAYDKSVRTCYTVHSPVKLEMRAARRGSSILSFLRYTVSSQLLHRVERNCLRGSDLITTDSSYTRSLLGTLHDNELKQKAQVIPGWVDLNRFKIVSDRDELKRNLGWSTDVPVFFSLRRLVPRMGLDRLLYAAKKVKDGGRKFQLIIGGSGPLRNQLEALVHDFSLREYVQFIGFVPEETLPLMYAAADAFILPTAKLECFGLIAIESLACGRPVLTTPVAAIPEIVEGIEPKWIANDNTSDSISDLMMAFLGGDLPVHNPESLRDFVRSRYDKERVLKQMAELILGYSR